MSNNIKEFFNHNWNLVCVATKLNKDNKNNSVQWQATKSIEGCKSQNYTFHLEKLQIPTLSYQWKHGDVIMGYKILKTQSLQQNMIRPDQSVGKQTNTRLQNKFW